MEGHQHVKENFNGIQELLSRGNAYYHKDSTNVTYFLDWQRRNTSATATAGTIT